MSEVNDTISLAQKLIQPEPKTIKDARGVEWLLLPANGTWNAKQLTPDSEVKANPAHAEARAQVHTTTSLINYLNRFKTPDTMIFADLQQHKLVAVVDYHSEGSAKPGLRKHSVTLQLSHSNEWDTWGEFDDDLMSQKAMARFLEENKLDVISPNGGDLLEIVLDMEKGVNMRVGRKMASAGSDRGRSDSMHEVDGTDIPPVWALRFPVFTGEPAVDITAFARDAIDEGKIMVGYKLSRLENIKEAELTRIALLVGTDTNLPVVLGAPG